MNTRRNDIVISTILIISALIVATAAPAAMAVTPQPPTPFYISGEVNYDNGDPVTSPTVTVENTNTGEGFDVNISGNAYQVTTSSNNVSAGDVLHFNASNDNVTEFNHTVTQDEMDAGGFVQNITIVHPAALMPDLLVTAINAYHNNTGCPAWFNLSNEIDVTVKNNGSATANASNVCLYIEDVFFGKLPVSSLAAGASETVTFEDWKPIGDDCLQPPCEFELLAKYYNFTGVADCDNNVAESNETNNETTVVDKACYNGYMADEPLENVAHGKLHGHMIYTTGDGVYSSLYSVGDTQVTNYDITIPAGATVKVANLNVYYTWCKPQGTCPEMEVSIQNGTGTYILPLEKAYNDVKCTCPGASWILMWGNYVYDVADYIDGSGTYTVTVKNVCTACQYFCPAAPGIVLVYEDANAPLIEYWINKGADVLMGGRRYSTSSNLAWWENINNATFPASTQTGEVVNATLGVVSPWGGSSWAPGMTNFLFFNDVKLGTGVYHGYGETYKETIDSITMEVNSTNAQVGVNVTSVTAHYLKGSDNVVGQADDGDNMMPSNAFLVVEYEEVVVPPMPDLNITAIWCELLRKNTYLIHYNITNIGDAEAGRSVSNLTVDGGRMKRDGVKPLVPGQTREEKFTYRSKTAPGTIKVCADFKDRIAESDETNNCLKAKLDRIDQECLDTGASSALGPLNWQEFRPTFGSLTRVAIRAYTYHPDQTLTLKVKKGDEILTTSTQTIAESGWSGWLIFDVPDISLVPEESYIIEVWGGIGSGMYWGGEYPRGAAGAISCTGPYNLPGDKDWAFRTYGYPPSE